MKLLEVKEVSFAYPNGSSILHHLDFSFPPGALILIEGKNGSGKTTLARLLLGLLFPITGKIVRNYKKAFYIPQQSIFDRQYPYTLEDILFMGQKPGYFFSQGKRRGKAGSKGFFRENRKERKQRIEEFHSLLSRLGLKEHKDLHFSKASGGQVQRALLGSALLSCSDFLVLDEPFVYLDKGVKETIISVLREKNKEEKLTLCIIEHSIEKQMSDALPFTHSISIEEGQAVLEEL